nr:restriction endonuclease subunit S [uncultured Pedobacter sp.]
MKDLNKKDWELVKLGDVVKCITGKTPPTKTKEYFDGDTLWVTPADLNQKYITSTVRTLTNKAIHDKKCNPLPKNAIVLNCIGDIGRVSILKEEGTSNQQITAIIPNKEIEVGFLYYMFINKKASLINLSNSAVVPILNNERLKTLTFKKPPFPTQKYITQILDKADALRKKDQQLLQYYDDLAQSLFINLFGDPVKNEKGWEVKKLGELGNLDRGVSKHRPRNAPELLGGKYPLIQTGDIANSGGIITSYKYSYSEIGLKQSKLWPKGTLCITVAANIAKTGVLDFDACFPDSVVGFKPNTLSNNRFIQFLFAFLQKMLEDSAPESAQKNINLDILRNLLVIAPSIELQNQFAQQIQNIEKQKEKVKAQMQASEETFQSLLQQVFA